MKQHITPEQLNELSEKGKERLRKWWIKSGVHEHHLVVGPNDVSNEYLWLEEHLAQGGEIKTSLPLLSIGQLIEFLEEHKKFKCEYGTEPADVLQMQADGLVIIDWDRDKELVDILWEAVKEVLDENQRRNS